MRHSFFAGVNWQDVYDKKVCLYVTLNNLASAKWFPWIVIGLLLSEVSQCFSLQLFVLIQMNNCSELGVLT